MILNKKALLSQAKPHDAAVNLSNELIISSWYLTTVEVIQPMWPQIIKITEKQTDGQTTYNGNTALCLFVPRAVIIDNHNGTNRKRVCDFLLVINSNLGSILPRFPYIRAFADRRGYLIMSLSWITTWPRWSLQLSEINNIMYAVKILYITSFLLKIDPIHISQV